MKRAGTDRAAHVRESISHLVIVSRDRPEVFERLHARFIGTAGIVLIFDRRKAPHQVHVENRVARASRRLRLLTDGFMVVPMERSST